MIVTEDRRTSATPEEIMHPDRIAPLRVALLAGELTQGGAEKQLVYMVLALQRAGVDTRVFSLTRDEFYDRVLRDAGVNPIWFGRNSHPTLRLASLIQHLKSFRPHVVQAIHAFTNLYAAAVVRFIPAIGVGGLRCDLGALSRRSGKAKYLLSLPDALAVNSRRAFDDVRASGWVRPECLYLLHNAIDLDAFRVKSFGATAESFINRDTIACIGSLLPGKRVDLFLRALALARVSQPKLNGIVVGDGVERGQLEELAAALGLSPQHARFLGARADIPAILKRVGVLVVCSESEGCPNVVLEAMAAGVPVVAPAVGDIEELIEDGITGCIVSHEVPEIAAGILRSAAIDRGDSLAISARIISHNYGLDALPGRLLSMYHSVAVERGKTKVRQAITACTGLSVLNCR